MTKKCISTVDAINELATSLQLSDTQLIAVEVNHREFTFSVQDYSKCSPFKTRLPEWVDYLVCRQRPQDLYFTAFVKDDYFLYRKDDDFIIKLGNFYIKEEHTAENLAFKGVGVTLTDLPGQAQSFNFKYALNAADFYGGTVEVYNGQ